MVRNPVEIFEPEAKESTSSSHESKSIGNIEASHVELRDTQRPYELTDNERIELPGTAGRIASEIRVIIGDVASVTSDLGQAGQMEWLKRHVTKRKNRAAQT